MIRPPIDAVRSTFNEPFAPVALSSAGAGGDRDDLRHEAKLSGVPYHLVLMPRRQCLDQLAVAGNVGVEVDGGDS